MTDTTSIEEIARKQVIYRVPGMEDVVVVTDVPYGVGAAGDLTMDIFYPPDHSPARRMPLVVLVAGYPFPAPFIKQWGPGTSWARLLAASGIGAVLYASERPDADLQALLRHLGEHGDRLGIDCRRIALWSSSGNVPTALAALTGTAAVAIRCAVLCYGFMLDPPGSTATADAAREYGFANPCAGKTLTDLAHDVPLFIVRAGREQFAGLNETIDQFVAAALACNQPLTLINHAGGSHGFDLDDDSPAGRAIVRQILAFLNQHLPGDGPG